MASVAYASVHGVVLDDRGRPLAGAVVSALGATTTFAVSDEDGRFALRNLPFGPYVMRAHLQGYLPPRARIVEVNRPSLTVSSIALTRRDDDEEVPVLAAGIGGADLAAAAAGDEAEETHDHGEVAWRLRHLKRSVLKSATTGLLDFAGDSLFGESLTGGLSRAVGTPARFASSLFADVPWTGHFDLLTSTAFDRPQDLFSGQTWLPRGVAFLSLEAPTLGGRWDVRGAVTQGDLSSWIVAASYHGAPAAHRYETGLSYGAQQYLHGAADRTAVADASRTVGAVYAYDEWTMTRAIAVGYGAKYARYDYLSDAGLFSPRASLTVTPIADDTFKVRAAVSRRQVAPGAEEFIPPSSGLWLPPERTFSSVSPRRGFTPERVDHVELAAERAWAGDVIVGVRAFRQHVDDQLVTLFGLSAPGQARATASHYYVASAGDVDARGWGVSVGRTVAERLRASIDYTQIHSTWLGRAPDAQALAMFAPSIRRDERERFHDLTTSLDTTLPVTATRVYVVYKVSSRVADREQPSLGPGGRFDVQFNQALPFLQAAGGQWEMLVAVRTLFREELLDTSVYDELLVVRPPKRVVGGVTVKF